MKGYIKISDIEKYCEDVVKTHQDLIKRALREDGTTADVSAAAFFMQQERIYKYEIPNMIKELSDGNELLNEHINVLGLSNSSYNILLKSNITTVGELSKMTIRELKSIAGLGSKILKEILEVTKKAGVEIRP